MSVLELESIICISLLTILGTLFLILGIINKAGNIKYRKECKERYFEHLKRLEKIEIERNTK